MYRDEGVDLDEHDRAVGAILIGETLVAQCERNADAVRVARAVDRWSAMREIQDDYPEIWRQLDRARDLLAARGSNTTGYEELRPHVRAAVATNRVDRDAFEDARRAIAELKLAMPGTDWKGIEKRSSTFADMPQLRRRHRVAVIGVVAGLITLAVAWFLSTIPEHKVDQRELMRRELVGVTAERKVKIAQLSHVVYPACERPVARELVKLLVLDGRGDAADQFADDFLVRCGEDTVVENWANAPRAPVQARR